MKYSFKVFSGEQAGAQIDLQDDYEYRVGSDFEQCEIFLHALNLDDLVYCNLKLQEDQITFNQINALIIDTELNNLVDNLPYTLPLFFTIGDVKVGVGDEMSLADWPPINSVKFDTENNDNLLNPDDAIDDLGLATFDDSKNVEQPNISTESFKVSLLRRLKKFTTGSRQLLQHLIAVISQKIQYYYHKQKIYFLAAIAAFVVIIISASLVIQMFHTQIEDEKLINNELTKQQLIKTQFNSLPAKFSNLMLTHTETGSYIINGVVDNAVSSAFLTNYFKPYAKQIKLNTITVNDAKQQIAAILPTYQLNNLTIGYNKNSDEMALQGFTEYYPSLEDLEIEINNKIPQLKQIDTSKVYDSNQLIKDVQDNIITPFQENLSVKFNLAQSQITITGFLDKDSLSKVNQKIAVIEEKYSGLNINSTIKDITSALPFKIYSVYSGNPGFIITGNGQKIFTGGSISGFKIQSISSSKIVFNGKFLLVLPIDNMANYEPQINNIPNKKNNSGGRNVILAEEAVSLNNALQGESQQLSEIQKYKNQIQDKKIVTFLESQSYNLEQDIQMKQKSLELLGNN